MATVSKTEYCMLQETTLMVILNCRISYFKTQVCVYILSHLILFFSTCTEKQQCTPDIVATFIVAIRIIVATFPGTKYIYSIIFRSNIVARKEWPNVATISEVHCINV